MIKLIACDLDGTIFDDHKNIDTDLKEVVDKLKEKGIEFTVVSGRNKELYENVVEYFNIDIPHAGNNGASIFLNDECIHLDCISSKYVNDIARLLHDNDIVFRVYAIEEIFANKISDFFLARMNFIKPILEYTTDLDLSKYSVYKITSDVINHEDKVDDLIKQINAFPNTIYTKAEDHIYCVNSSSANKGDGLKWIMNYLNIQPEEVMIFGDNDNDLGMFEVAKTSIAMGNSVDNIKEIATFICDDNNHNGVSKFLKEYFKDIL